jgi:hypothetical protein
LLVDEVRNSGVVVKEVLQEQFPFENSLGRNEGNNSLETKLEDFRIGPGVSKPTFTTLVQSNVYSQLVLKSVNRKTLDTLRKSFSPFIRKLFFPIMIWKKSVKQAVICLLAGLALLWVCHCIIKYYLDYVV